MKQLDVLGEVEYRGRKATEIALRPDAFLLRFACQITILMLRHRPFSASIDSEYIRRLVIDGYVSWPKL